MDENQNINPKLVFSVGYGKEADVPTAIEDEKLTPGALVVTTDTHKLLFVDEDKQSHELSGNVYWNQF